MEVFLMAKKPTTSPVINDFVGKIGNMITRGFVVINGLEINVKGYIIHENGSGCDIRDGKKNFGGGVRIVKVKTKRVK